MRKIQFILIFFLIPLMTVFAESDRNFTFTMDKKQIQIEIPEGWEKYDEYQNEGKKGWFSSYGPVYGIQFIHADHLRLCYIKCCSSQEDENVPLQIKENLATLPIFFPFPIRIMGNTPLVTQAWQTFQIENQNSNLFVGLARNKTQSMQFDIVIINLEGDVPLREDATAFAQAIKIIKSD